MSEYLGWVATAVFAGSYFCAGARTIKRVQMGGALLWVLYGILIGAQPVIVANLLVLGAAAWSSSSEPEVLAISRSDTSTPSALSAQRTVRTPAASRR